MSEDEHGKDCRCPPETPGCPAARKCSSCGAQETPDNELAIITDHETGWRRLCAPCLMDEVA